jgi:hypothetical protein
VVGDDGGGDAGELADDLKPIIRHREAEGESSHDPGGVDLVPAPAAWTT